MRIYQPLTSVFHNSLLKRHAIFVQLCLSSDGSKTYSKPSVEIRQCMSISAPETDHFIKCYSYVWGAVIFHIVAHLSLGFMCSSFTIV